LAKFFISHSSKDAGAARELMEWLRSRGYDHVFLDVDGEHRIPPGAHWESVLYQQIKESVAVILILTPAWFDSCWCFAEFAQARVVTMSLSAVV
jgi:TIR domain